MFNTPPGSKWLIMPLLIGVGMERKARVLTELPYNPKIAYFSMEICVRSDIPTYSGGLGILAGDTIRSCADLNIPIVAITLLSEKGYFDQDIIEEGEQVEKPSNFDPASSMYLVARETSVRIGNSQVKIRPWFYPVTGSSGYQVPVIFLDTNVEGNGEWERTLTSYLYGGDEKYRLAQEIVLGIGGVRILKALGFTGIYRYHMNEGHASLLTLELYNKTRNVDYVRSQCVFTTHTPVPAGHDKFDIELVRELMGEEFPKEILPHVVFDGKLNMTKLGMFFSHYINGVAKRHREVSQELFPGYSIDSITNGVHSPTWVSKPFRRLFNIYIPGWKSDPYMLRYASSIPKNEIWKAHMEAKKKLLDYVKRSTGIELDLEVFTIGFARRMTEYKRPDMLISDLSELLRIKEEAGDFQIIYSGKAHPKDIQGKMMIKKIFRAQKELEGKIKIVFIKNYNMEIAKLMVSGVDLWLNNPKIPMEASGTSGMKAAHNGVPQLSTLDGWWKEGCIEGVTGWSIGNGEPSNDEEERKDMYRKLREVIIPMFYREREKWIEIMRNCIALNASFFNTQRMVEQYVLNAYFL